METQLRKIEVEVLTEKHLHWFVDVAAVRMLSEELKRPDLVNKQALQALSEKTIEDGTSFVATCSGVPVGALGSLFTPNLYNPDLTILLELFWYVLPDYRTTRAGALLFKAFDDKAKDCADESVLSLLPHSAVNLSTLAKKGYNMEELCLRKQCRGVVWGS